MGAIHSPLLEFGHSAGIRALREKKCANFLGWLDLYTRRLTLRYQTNKNNRGYDRKTHTHYVRVYTTGTSNSTSAERESDGIDWSALGFASCVICRSLVLLLYSPSGQSVCATAMICSTSYLLWLSCQPIKYSQQTISCKANNVRFCLKKWSR